MKETKSIINYIISRQVLDFWFWWTNELMTAIPTTLRQLLFNSNKLVLNIEEGSIKIYKIIGIKEEYITQIQDLDITTAKVNSLIGGGNIAEKIVVIPHDQVLAKKVTFPIATEENIREVLSFEMDRLTPFKSSQVYYDNYLISRNKNKSTIDLKLVVIPRDRIDSLLDKLSRMDIRPHVVTAKDDSAEKVMPINLLPVEKRAKKINALKIINYTLVGVMLILLVVSLLFPIWNKMKYIEKLEPELTDLTKNAEQITKLRKQVEKAEGEALFLTEKKENTLLVLEVVDELTQIIPDDTWVSQLEIKNNEVHIHGESVSSASLLPIIEASEIFVNAQFRSPVTQNRRNNTERFHLSAKLRQEEAL
jgi:general secretion pathway protein L